ncbi:MAG: transposase [Nitrososphaerota archaeon]|nr:transposase [Nitrososphaerota archaeon]MDG6943783.1 transposase [Nitrososphaerota archaeon]
MTTITQGEVYLEDEHVPLIKSEEEYVKQRYYAVARTLAEEPLRITRAQAAEKIGISVRQMKRVVKRFLTEGIAGLRKKSTRPHNSPNRISVDVENRIVEVRKATGFGSGRIAAIINAGLELEGKNAISDSTCYNVLVRNGLVEAERRAQNEYKSFEWGHADELVQADITYFNGVPIMTMEDDHSRMGWATSMNDSTEERVTHAMKTIHPGKYENLLTDNGSQFSKKNTNMKHYCEENIIGIHIWTSVHHPQTMGKLSNMQKGLKRFLRHRLGRSTNMSEIDESIRTYLNFYNNAAIISTTGKAPAERYSSVDQTWYERFVKALKLENILPVDRAVKG